MLASEDNERVTRVGRGTPMGNTMRRYWIRALLAWELPEPDGPPVRVKLLGEELVAFRDSRGRIGLLDEHCPHRRVSLFLGRNEECGLRCVYHGWKFDVDGRCVDMMNEPAELGFAHKIRTTAYPTVDVGGVVWAYLGPAQQRPPLPRFAWTQAAPTHRHVSKVIQETNWLQGLEGGIDTSHVPILHRVLSADSTRPGFKPTDPFVRGKAPTLELDLTDYGYRYAGLRALDDGTVHVRAYHFILPFHQIRPARAASGRDFSGVAGHIWVPMDDETTMVYNWEYSLTTPLTEEDRLERRLGNGPLDVDQTTFRSRRNRENGYLQDRRVQKTETFTGIDGVNAQDRAVQESMGRIVDRAGEHLGPADRAVIQARRLLLQATRTVETGGTPPGVAPTYYTLEPAEAVLARDADWRTLLAPDAPRPELPQQVSYSSTK
jgi:phthalate 4,5-dioxygenase